MKKGCYLLLLAGMFLFSCKRQTTGYEETTATRTPDEPNSCCAPELLDKAWYTSGKKAPLFSGLEGIRFFISSKSEEAKRYFNQGMMLSYGFNHAEAARSFYEAARQDSTCGMCWWGFAYVLGPNYNAGMEPDNYQRAYDAVQKAVKYSKKATPREKDLIQALTFRYTDDSTIARPYLDSAYAAAMRRVYKKYPDDPDIGALFAESLMDLHPWNLWQKDGTIQPWTPEILEVLEKTIRLSPKHAGAHHFYIHATEMSKTAELASASADLLRDLVPGSGHLVHMPSHTYIRTGKYHDAVLANLAAVKVDSLYTVSCHAQGVYPLAYFPHNYHFLAACATLCGESAMAVIGAKETRDHAHKKLMEDPMWATLQHYYTIPWFIDVKLGRWDAIARSEVPEQHLKYPKLVWHYAQGMRALSGNKIKDARVQLQTMKTIMKDSTLKALTIWGINSIYDIGNIAVKVLEGEIYAKEKNFGKAVQSLQSAVETEDALNYDEPPDWFFSTRHHLGAVLVEAGKFSDAIKVYEKDLETFRENGWVLRGLMNAYRESGNQQKYKETKTRFDKAWQYADIKINASRIL